MPKYKPSDALKIKQEIARGQREVDYLRERKRELAEEIEELEKGARTKEVMLHRREQNLLLRKAENALAEREAQHQAAVTALQREKESLERSVRQLADTLTAFRSEIRALASRPVEDPTTYLRSVAEALTSAIEGLSHQYETRQEEVADLDQQVRAAQLAKERLEFDKTELEGHIASLEAQLHDTAEDHIKIAEQLAEARKQLDAIEKRERDSQVMMRRLSEDYQRVYRQLPHR